MTTTTVTLTMQVRDPQHSLSLLRRLLVRSCFRDVTITTEKGPASQ